MRQTRRLTSWYAYEPTFAGTLGCHLFGGKRKEFANWAKDVENAGRWSSEGMLYWCWLCLWVSCHQCLYWSCFKKQSDHFDWPWLIWPPCFGGFSLAHDFSRSPGRNWGLRKLLWPFSSFKSSQPCFSLHGSRWMWPSLKLAWEAGARVEHPLVHTTQNSTPPDSFIVNRC